MSNKRGSLLVDAMMALVMIGMMALLLVSAMQAYRNALKEERRQPHEERIPVWLEEGKRIYDD